MTRVSEYIATLLSQVDHLVVPNIGKFEIQKSPAEVLEDDRGMRIEPPYNTIVFHPLTGDSKDTELLQTYMVLGDLSYEKAKEAMEEDITALKSTLSRGEEVKIPNIGTLKQGADQSISFVQCPVEERKDEFSGLKAVRISKIGYASERREKLPIVREDGGEWIKRASWLESNDNSFRFKVSKHILCGVGVLLIALLFVGVLLKSKRNSEPQQESITLSLKNSQRNMGTEEESENSIDTVVLDFGGEESAKTADAIRAEMQAARDNASQARKDSTNANKTVSVKTKEDSIKSIAKKEIKITINQPQVAEVQAKDTAKKKVEKKPVEAKEVAKKQVEEKATAQEEKKSVPTAIVENAKTEPVKVSEANRTEALRKARLEEENKDKVVRSNPSRPQKLAGYYVILSTSNSESATREAVSRLKREGFNEATYFVSVQDEREVFNLCAGHYSTLPEATSALRSVRKDVRYKNAWIRSTR